MSDQVKQNAIALGRGAGTSGLKSLAYGQVGEYLQGQGNGNAPIFSSLPSGVVGFLMATNRFFMAAADVTQYNAALVYNEPYRLGLFYKKLYADYAADVAADIQQGFVVRSTNDPNFVWVRDVINQEYQIDWFRTSGASKTDDTTAVLDGIQAIPDGGTVYFSPIDYNLYEMSATTRGSLTIIATGARILNTTQVYGPSPLGLPIFRIFVQDFSHDLTIDGLTIEGPRLTTDTTVGTGVYGGNPFAPGTGFPSGIDVPIGNRVIVKNCTVSGTFYSGIECHYIKDLTLINNKTLNHGYAGILFTDSEKTNASSNIVDDIGSVAPNNGYGISAATSYNYPGYAYGNDVVSVTNNKVTRCKRKAYDVHNAFNIIVSNNYAKGSAYGYVEAICEGADKQISNIIIANNEFENDPTFLGGTTAYTIFSAGSYAPASPPAAQDIFIIITGNITRNMVAPNGVTIGNTNVPGTNTRQIDISNNLFANCNFSGPAIASANYSQLVNMVTVVNNKIQAYVGTAHIYIQNTVDCLSTGNICRNLGTPPTTVTTVFNGVTNANTINNMLDGVLGG